MGLVYADIELINGEDITRFKDNLIQEEQIRRVTAHMMVDSGATMMAINQTIKAQLGLKKKRTQIARLADGSPLSLEVVGPIEVRFANREATVNALVLSGDTEPLLGAIPMEEMDVVIHPTANQLVVHPDHPNMAVVSLK